MEPSTPGFPLDNLLDQDLWSCFVGSFQKRAPYNGEQCGGDWVGGGGGEIEQISRSLGQGGFKMSLGGKCVKAKATARKTICVDQKKGRLNQSERHGQIFSIETAESLG